MQIVCPQCASTYEVSAASLGADGRSVRCASCHTIWFASAPPVFAQTGAKDGTQNAPQDPADPLASFDAQIAANEAAYAGDDAGSMDGPAARDPSEFGVTGADRLSDDPDYGRGGNDLHEVSFVNASEAPAEPAMFGDSPSIVPPIEDSGVSPFAAKALPGEDIESLAARRQAQLDRRRFWRKLKMPGWPTLIVALGAVILVLLASRNVVVQYAPQTASFYASIGLPVNLRGLDFENIRVIRETQDGVPVLVVEGKIVSTTKQIAEVPRMRFAIHDAAGREIYTWTMMPTRTLLAPGETQPFRSRLASPPAEGREISLRFFNRHDAISGLR